MAARDVGLKGLGLSEHAPGLPGTCDPIYFTNLRAVPRTLYGVNIYYGVENNVLDDGTMALPERILQMLDYNIVGIHGICYKDQGVEGNTENLIKCMSHPKTFFVSHPDDGAYPLDYQKVVLAAKEYGVALELNNSHIKHPWRKNSIENMHEYLKLCMKYKTNIFIGSDAHDPSQIGDFNEAIKLLDEMGFDEELIINNSETKFKEFIKFKE